MNNTTFQSRPARVDPVEANRAPLSLDLSLGKVFSQTMRRLPSDPSFLTSKKCHQQASDPAIRISDLIFNGHLLVPRTVWSRHRCCHSSRRVDSPLKSSNNEYCCHSIYEPNLGIQGTIAPKPIRSQNATQRNKYIFKNTAAASRHPPWSTGTLAAAATSSPSPFCVFTEDTPS